MAERASTTCHAVAAGLRAVRAGDIEIVGAGRVDVDRVPAATVIEAVRLDAGDLTLRDLLTDPPATRRRRPSRLGSMLARALPVDLARRIGRMAVSRRASAHLVGGVVRDLLLGRPIRDLDVVVVGEMEPLARDLASSLRARVRSHLRFGTAELRLPDGGRIDLVRARRETYGVPAALPSVEPGTLADDLFRRDFAINAMAVDLDPRRFGMLVDPFGGAEDLERGCVRVLHGVSFLHDPTRAFRAARFCHRLGFRPGSRTRRLIAVALARGVAQHLSGRRVLHELELAFAEPRPAGAAAVLRRWGLLAEVHPGLARGGVDLGPSLTRLGHWLDGRGGLRWATLFGALVATLPARERRQVVDHLRPSRRVRRILEEGRPVAVRLARCLGGRRAPRPSAVHAACAGLPTELVLLAASRAEVARVRRDLLRWVDVLRHVRPDVGGGDLLAAGIQPGPAVAAGLEAALRRKLDGGRAVEREEQLTVAVRAARRSA